MKTCSACHESLPLESFSRRGSGYQSKCKECNKAYYKAYYRDNPNEKTRLTQKRLTERAAIDRLVKEAKSVPCADCKREYPSYVMQFDHLDPKLKEFNIGLSRHLYTIKKICEEIAKCEVVCANCHAERTWGPKGS